MYAIGVFVDQKKAFDTVNLDILANNFNFYGVHGIAHEQIVSYLENRKQFVQYKKCESNILNVCCDVPQGSILEPNLFIIYINDICNISFYLLMMPTCFTVILL